MEEFVPILLCFENAAHMSSAQTGFGSGACFHLKTLLSWRLNPRPSTEAKNHMFICDFLPQILETIDFYELKSLEGLCFAPFFDQNGHLALWLEQRSLCKR